MPILVQIYRNLHLKRANIINDRNSSHCTLVFIHNRQRNFWSTSITKAILGDIMANSSEKLRNHLNSRVKKTTKDAQTGRQTDKLTVAEVPNLIEFT